MRCASRLVGRAPWAVFSVLAVLIATDPAAHPPGRFSCDAQAPPSASAEGRRSSSATVEGAASDGGADVVARGGDDARRFSDAFFQCYADAKQKDSALSCVGEGARVGLESFFTRRDVHVSDGLTLVQEEAVKDAAGEGREMPIPFPEDVPSPLFDGQHRSVIDSAAAYLSARALRWDMSGLYPGLTMRVGPTLSGSGWLEFVLEPRRIYNDRQLGPSRMVLKQVVLPFLLGVKVSVASLVPLLLFGIVFLAKKALLMSQLSALMSGLLGFGAYSHSYGYGHPHAFGPEGGGGLGGGFGGGLGGGLGGPHINNPLLPFRTSPQVFPKPQRAPPPVEEGPHILHLGGHPLPGSLPALPVGAPLAGGLGPGLGGPLGVAPSWLSGTPQHLFRKVNYDFRDERHAAAAASTSTANRNTKGFRWEDEANHYDPGDPRTRPDDEEGRTGVSRSSNNIWGTRSLG